MGVEVNKLILENIDSFLNKNPDVPKSLRDLYVECLKLESQNTSLNKKGLEKLYSQVFKNFSTDKSLLKWCGEYVRN